MKLKPALPADAVDGPAPRVTWPRRQAFQSVQYDGQLAHPGGTHVDDS